MSLSRKTADKIIVCERYSLLSNDKKQMIAGELDRSVREIERKISVSFTTPCGVHSNDELTRFAGHADTRGILASAEGSALVTRISSR